jgi:hypothetical protein
MMLGELTVKKKLIVLLALTDHLHKPPLIFGTRHSQESDRATIRAGRTGMPGGLQHTDGITNGIRRLELDQGSA